MSRGTSLHEPFRTIVALIEETDAAPEGLELYDWRLLEDAVEDLEGNLLPVLAMNSPAGLVAFSVGGTYTGFDFRAGWTEVERVAALVYSPARVL